ncbi:arrestin homolog [Artemia franciscana]|uniref:Arrestin C-terminal-like domain-containing protein n=1 Tax=Artemia franciscana TaxID=6661 RepID=A0AA88I338_ARTSF|nr:hypothetical protein QYM36_009820 [Artemia franciscana]
MVATVKVFKKTSPNGKLTVYLGKRDFVDHQDSVDPIEGVVVVDGEYLKNRKVFGQVITSIRYGRERDEVMGLQFCKEMVLISEQIAPDSKTKSNLSPLQEKLLKKLGSDAHAFTFQLPTTAPTSVVLQENSNDQPMGIEYDLRAFVGENQDDRGHKRSSVSLAIRKVQYAPSLRSQKQPSTLVSKGFTFSSGKLNMEVTLDKELYYHNEPVGVNILVTNNSKKTVKNIQVSILQNVEITIVNSHFSKRVSHLESREGCPITPGSSLTKTFMVTPVATSVKEKQGIALDGYMRDEDVNLASSTLSERGSNDATGFIITYTVRVQLNLGAISGELVADVPMKLMHPMPGTSDKYGRGKGAPDNKVISRYDNNSYAKDEDENIIFEDFARLRMNEPE